MPIYEYRCRSCSEKFEKLIFSTQESVQCPHCGSKEMEKLFSQFQTSQGSSSSVQPSCGSGGCCPGCKKNP